ncbi:MAG: TlyA family RNA methyltransferase [Deltaproteobacteria bacterium]|nr:TlyA family RNA methyltransferase [Deltaproteobacteria bacterium]
MSKQRLDILVFESGLADSRQKAQSLIMAGKILVNETPVTKAGTKVDSTLEIRIRGEANPFVSRGGLKLNGALDDLKANVENKIIIDVGASTGGFTDCCLQRGAKYVYAVDVGTNQLAWKLRNDNRVKSIEQTNAKEIMPHMFDPLPEVAVIDVSFISITKIFDAVSECLTENAEIFAMVKPQFEAGRENVGKGGVVKDDAVRLMAAQKVIDYATNKGFTLINTTESKVPGPKGNREIFIHLKR